MKVTIARNEELLKCITNLLHADVVDITFKGNIIYVDKHHPFSLYILLQTIKNISVCPTTFSMRVKPMSMWSALTMCTKDEPFELSIQNQTVTITQGNRTSVFPLLDEAPNNVLFENRFDTEILLEKEDTVTKTKIKMEKLENDFRKIFEAEAIGKFPPFYTLDFKPDCFYLNKGNEEHNISFLEYCDVTGPHTFITTRKDIERIVRIFDPSQDVQIKCYGINAILFSQKVGSVKYDYSVPGMVKV